MTGVELNMDPWMVAVLMVDLAAVGFVAGAWLWTILHDRKERLHEAVRNSS